MSVKMNHGFANLSENYLFAEIKKRTADFRAAHPDTEVISLGIGDVTRPLSGKVTSAMAQAARELGTSEGFRGYGAEQGYDFLKEAVRNYYGKRDVSLDLDEIFISDGAKSDCGNITELFDQDNTVLIPDPVYPVYADTNIMAGRRICYLAAGEENGFLPLPEDIEENGIAGGAVIYLCSPNNPTGAAYNREGLQAWVDYANETGSVILFDAAYECFITEEYIPHSIFEIPGARNCAIEICSLSKKAGFTGTRCGYTVVPKNLVRDGFPLHAMWLRRQCTKYNGTAYIIQRGAEAAFSPENERQLTENIQYYLKNAELITQTLNALNVYYTGGKNAPYIWLRCPEGMSSWTFFDTLLERCHVIGTPGAGFGSRGEGYFRLTAFSTRENTAEAMRRIREGGIFQ